MRFTGSRSALRFTLVLLASIAAPVTIASLADAQCDPPPTALAYPVANQKYDLGGRYPFHVKDPLPGRAYVFTLRRGATIVFSRSTSDGYLTVAPGDVDHAAIIAGSYQIDVQAVNAGANEGPAATASFAVVASRHVASPIPVPVLLIKFLPVKPDGTVDFVRLGVTDPANPIVGQTATQLDLTGTLAATQQQAVARDIAATYRHDGQSIPSLDYFIASQHSLTFLQPVPVRQVPNGADPESGPVTLGRADHAKIFGPNGLTSGPAYRRSPSGVLAPVTGAGNICHYVDQLGIREVWLQMYHTDEVAPVESVGSMGTLSQSYWNSPGYGCFGNANCDSDQFDLPVCSHSYTVYEYNAPGFNMDTHTFGHHLEDLLPFVDRGLFERFSKPPYSTVGQANVIPAGWGRTSCGNTHFPPNSEGFNDYFYTNPNAVVTNCADWRPDGTGRTRSTSCDPATGGWSCQTSSGNPFEVGNIAYQMWWKQWMPGRNNNLSYIGHTLLNWWEFVGDLDAALAAHGKTLVYEPKNFDLSASLRFQQFGRSAQRLDAYRFGTGAHTPTMTTTVFKMNPAGLTGSRSFNIVASWDYGSDATVDTVVTTAHSIQISQPSMAVTASIPSGAPVGTHTVRVCLTFNAADPADLFADNNCAEGTLNYQDAPTVTFGTIDPSFTQPRAGDVLWFDLPITIQGAALSDVDPGAIASFDTYTQNATIFTWCIDSNCYPFTPFTIGLISTGGFPSIGANQTKVRASGFWKAVAGVHTVRVQLHASQKLSAITGLSDVEPLRTLQFTVNPANAPHAPGDAYPGDCNADYHVGITDLVTLTNIVLGQQPLSACPSGDRDGSGTVTVTEIVHAVLLSSQF
ncbi:MAG TPA: hypothetical protein VGR62_05045 [Candidatus Binatia bacterium]|jgi:hypothetical protein|nr:hypothetical protein [Candidatus Binatia bacterium]